MPVIACGVSPRGREVLLLLLQGQDNIRNFKDGNLGKSYCVCCPLYWTGVKFTLFIYLVSKGFKRRVD